MTLARTAALALLLATTCISPALAAPPETLERVLAAPRLDRAAIARLYDRAVTGGGLPALHARLAAEAGSTAAPRARAAASLVAAYLYWQAGDMPAAMHAADAALALAPGGDALLLKAELTDAAGDPVAAGGWYRKALDAGTADAGERARLDVRIALIEALRRPEALAALAARQPPAVADRIAVALALLGRPAAALAASLPPGAGAAGVPKALRLAEWGLAANDPAGARARAWQAHAAATNADDRRYALALLLESFRNAGAMAQADAFLAGKPQTEDVVAARVDVLLELGRFDAAIALVRGADDPALRARLLGILDLAGRDAAGVAEYRRRIAADPHRPENYAGLAAVHVARGDDAAALAVYRELFAVNRGRTAVLVEGARRMIDAGLAEQAIAMVAASPGSDPAAAQRFLFDAYLELGRPADARRALDALLHAAPGDAAAVGFAADGYDRLGAPGEALALLWRTGSSPDYDRQLRMADLAERAGAPADALARWRAVWDMAALPARRSYAEKQIVRLAKQTGTLDALVAALAARVAAGTTRPGEIDLLVAMRLAQDDRAGAAADIERYAARAGGSETARLERLAALYTRMRDIPALNRTLRRLIAADPAQRDVNTRRLILNVARYGDGDAAGAARQGEIDRLLATLGSADGTATRSFAATIHADAGLYERSTAEFRAAHAAAPGDGDTLLQLAEALKRQGGAAKAGALLQHAMVAAPNPAAFATAAGGLLDLLAAGSGGAGLPRRATLLWVERRVLERVVAEGDDARTLGLLADLGQLLGDYDLQFRAYETALAAAGDQRAAALRQLVTLSSGSADGDATAGPAIGDTRRKLAYARRMLALRKSFPPDVYADLGGTLLAQGDKPGAERAFAMMSDMGGLVNVDAVKARAYAARGFAALALANYARALARDQNDLDLVVRTSILREQQGQGDIAFGWYWRALLRLVARQPDGTADAGGDAGVDVDRYYQTLLEGMVLTWPADAAGATAARAALAQLADATLAAVDRAAPGRVAAHRRLALVAGVQRRLVEARRDDGSAARWSDALDALFAGDPEHRRAVALRDDLTGTTPLAPGADWPTRVLQVQARDTGNVTLSLALAIARDDMTAVTALVTAALADEVAWRAALAGGGEPAARPPIFLSLFPELMDRLPAERFRSVVLAAIDASPIRDDLYFDLFRSAPDRYARVEALVGRPPLPDQRLLTMLVERGNSALNASARAGRAWSGGPGLERFSADQRVALYAGLVARMEQGGGDSGLAPVLLQTLVATPLAPAQLATLGAAMRRDLAFVRPADAGGGSALLSRLLLLDAAPANRATLIEAAQAAGERYPELRQLPAFLRAWFAGERAAALAALYALDADVRAKAPSDDVVAGIIQRRFPEAQAQEIDAFMAAPRPDAAAASRFHERHVAGHLDDTAPEKLIAYYRKLIAVAPDVADYRLGLARLYWQRQELEPFAQVLRELHAAHPDDEDAALVLILAERLAGHSEAAAAVARASGVNPEDAGGIVQLLNRGGADAGVPALFAAMYDAYAQRSPDATLVRTVAAQRGAANAASVGREEDAALNRLIEAQSRVPASVPGMLRALWRETAADPGGVERRALLQSLDAASQAGDARGRVAAAIVVRGDVTAELARYPLALDVQARAVSPRLHALIARGLIAQGQAAARLDALLAALGAGTIDDEQVGLLATLADATARVLDAASREALAARLRATPALGLDRRIVLARVFARSGDSATGLALLDAALMQLLYPFTPLDDGGDQSATAARIVAALDAWPDRQAARDAWAELAGRLRERRPATGDGSLALPPLGAVPGA